jgi:hypothetical protein
MAQAIAVAAEAIAGDRAWSGPAGRAAADLISRVQGMVSADLSLMPSDAAPSFGNCLRAFAFARLMADTRAFSSGVFWRRGFSRPTS